MGQNFDIVKSLQKDGDTLTVELFGSLGVDTADQLTEKIEGQLDDVKTLIFDMKMLAYVTSAGIRSLIRAIKIVKKNGGNVITRHVNQDVLGIFDLMNITSLVTIEG